MFYFVWKEGKYEFSCFSFRVVRDVCLCIRVLRGAQENNDILVRAGLGRSSKGPFLMFKTSRVETETGCCSFLLVFFVLKVISFFSQVLVDWQASCGRSVSPQKVCIHIDMFIVNGLLDANAAQGTLLVQTSLH